MLAIMTNNIMKVTPQIYIKIIYFCNRMKD